MVFIDHRGMICGAKNCEKLIHQRKRIHKRIVVIKKGFMMENRLKQASFTKPHCLFLNNLVKSTKRAFFFFYKKKKVVVRKCIPPFHSNHFSTVQVLYPCSYKDGSGHD